MIVRIEVSNGQSLCSCYWDEKMLLGVVWLSSMRAQMPVYILSGLLPEWHVGMNGRHSRSCARNKILAN